MMKKRFIALILCIFCAAALCVPACAFDLFAGYSPRVVDDADLLTDDEEELLTATLDEISERQQFDVVVVTVYSLDGEEIVDYTDDYFDYNGYGMGENYDGALLLISMEYRDWWISTSGKGEDVFSDEDIQYIFDNMSADLSNENYYDAFCVFAQLIDSGVENAKNGDGSGFYENGDYGNYAYGEEDFYDGGSSGSRGFGDGMSILKRAAAALFGGFIIALIVTGSMKSKLTSVRFQSGAADYTKKGSMNVTNASESFLYSTVTKIKKPEPENRSGKSGGSGGTHSSHTSSSGRSHGGGGGKF